MKRFFIKLALLVFVASLITTVANAQEAAEDKVLNRWLGAWKSDVVINRSRWFPKRVQRIETCEVRWIINNHMHMQLITNRSNKEENLLLQRYNPEKKVYEMWFFNPESAAYYVGGWNEKSSTMTWRYVDFNVGITGTVVDHFTKDGKWKQTTLLKGKRGVILLDIKIERSKIKTEGETVPNLRL